MYVLFINTQLRNLTLVRCKTNAILYKLLHQNLHLWVIVNRLDHWHLSHQSSNYVNMKMKLLVVPSDAIFLEEKCELQL